MADHLDDEISYEATPPPAKPPRPTHGGLTIAIAVLVVATGAAVYFAFIRSSSSPIAVTPLRGAAAARRHAGSDRRPAARSDRRPRPPARASALDCGRRRNVAGGHGSDPELRGGDGEPSGRR